MIGFTHMIVRSFAPSSRYLSMMKTSPIERHQIFGREIYVKRDDMLTFPEDIGINGNKIRKLQSLYDLQGDAFPRVVISHGGNQSNAMKAIALLCKHKNAKFLYLTRTISSSLKENPEGNFAAALAAGMQVSHYSYKLYDPNITM